MKFEKSTAVGKEPCPKCGSKDNLVRYEDGSAHCYTPDCKYFERPDKEKAGRISPRKNTLTRIQYDGDLLRIGNRHIELDQVKVYKVKTRENGTLIFPFFDEEGELTSTKLRSKAKKFMYTGDQSKLELFGQSAFGTGGKYLTITEGELDAMAARQMLGDFPVVSVHSSSTVERDVKNNIDFIESFEKVVLCMDDDEAGRKAAKTIAELLSPNKVLIATLKDHNDACDYLMANDGKKFTKGWWGAKAYTPVGVLTLSNAFSSYRERLKTRIIEIPDYFGEAKKMLNGGFAVGEITAIIADTSIGKTTQIVNLIEGILKGDEERHITSLMLETTAGEIVKVVIQKEFGVNIDVGDEYTEEQLDEIEIMYNEVEWTRRLHIIEHTGSLSGTEEIIKKLRNTAVSTNSELILVDPLQQAVPNIDHETIRHFMDELLKLAQQTKSACVVTSHIKNRSRKDAYDVTEEDAIGSSAIKQVSWTNIILTRDKKATDPNIKNATKISIDKCRRTGNTGEAGWILYEAHHGSFTSISNPLKGGGKVEEEEVFSV